jgi:hypothetical protein
MALTPYLREALVGFSDFEQRTLGSVLRLAGPRSGGYAQVAEIADADAIVANADAATVIAAVASARREADTVFVGRRRPAGAAGGCDPCLAKPVDADALRTLVSPPPARVRSRGRRKAGGVAFDPLAAR